MLAFITSTIFAPKAKDVSDKQVSSRKVLDFDEMEGCLEGVQGQGHGDMAWREAPTTTMVHPLRPCRLEAWTLGWHEASPPRRDSKLVALLPWLKAGWLFVRGALWDQSAC